MKARCAVIGAMALAVTLTSAAAGGAVAAKQRVAINMKVFPSGTFVLEPVGAGALERDSGSITNRSSVMATARSREVVRAGQRVTIFNAATWTLEGKLGTLTIRERNEWIDVGNDVNGDGMSDGIAQGRWSVVRGTGQYAGLVGGGRSGHVGLGRVWYSRAEGFLTPR